MPAQSPFCPWTALARLPGVKVLTTRLPDDEMGGWVPQASAVLLDHRLTPVEERSTAIHEYVHAERNDQVLAGHGPDGDRLHRRQEREVDRIAAELAIGDLDELAEALATTHSPAEAAEVLGVDEDTLWNRLRLCLSDGQKEYLQSRIDKIEGKTWPAT